LSLTFSILAAARHDGRACWLPPKAPGRPPGRAGSPGPGRRSSRPGAPFPGHLRPWPGGRCGRVWRWEEMHGMAGRIVVGGDGSPESGVALGW